MAQQAMINELREQNDSLRAMVRQLSDIIKNTKRGADGTETLVNESVQSKVSGTSTVPQKSEWASV